MPMQFNFKQFTVVQQYSAAKITTDATIFAAWLPILPVVQRVLEIGTGTGVMSLMVAQRSKAFIHAVEISLEAYEEARSNFKNSPYNDRLTITHDSVQRFLDVEKFDIVFSNPPFFNNNLKSAVNALKNIAYHSDLLPFNELAQSVDRLLKEDGQFYSMLPLYESNLFEQEMLRLGYSVSRTLAIKHNEEKKILRRIVGFSKNKKYHLKEEKLAIRNLDGTFHKDYVQLMKPFLTIF
ncbi:MAG: tRNA1Val (adenine37-N6)-methyltransferase [Marivirga sp.]|jgi:tRNA1Val (adenine37-N6)-methyltransferase